MIIIGDDYMLKKLSSGIFTIVLFFLISLLAILLLTRTIINSNTINDILNILMTNNNETINTDDIDIADNNKEDFVETILEEILNETTIPNEVIDYLENEKINEFVNDYINQTLQYLIGIEEMPSLNSEEFNTIINNAITEYENDTGNQVDKEEINNMIIEADEALSAIEIPSNTYTSTIKKILRICFDNRTLYLLIALTIICIVIIVMLSGIITTLKRIGVILIINGVLFTAYSLLISFLGNTNEIINGTLKTIIHHINSYGYSMFGVGVGLFVLMIILKPIIDKKKLEKIGLEEIKK